MNSTHITRWVKSLSFWKILEYTIKELNEKSFDEGFDFAIFCAGGEVSKKYAPIAALANWVIVIDNSSAFRMDKDVPLVVPEVNSEDIEKNNGIIANPNCSTIQAVVALKPLDDKYKIKRIVYSTYQAVSGAGLKGVEDLENTSKGLETKKILHNDKLKITATTVRVPVLNSHSESINVEFEKDIDINEVKELLKNSPGIILMDDVDNNIYPLATIANGKDQVYVGRLRKDESVDSGINMWVVADNIRKDAASNAIQIMEQLIK